MADGARTRTGQTTGHARQSYGVLALMLGASLLIGLFVLPRIGPASIKAGGLAEHFSLPIVAGGEPSNRVSLQALRGKVVVLDFWATWCGPCAEQAKILERFVSVPRADVVVLGINEGESVAQLDAYFERQRPVGYTMLSDSDELVGQSYGVRGLPTLVVIDSGGRIAATLSGVVPYGRLERLVEEASARR